MAQRKEVYAWNKKQLHWILKTSWVYFFGYQFTSLLPIHINVWFWSSSCLTRLVVGWGLGFSRRRKGGPIPPLISWGMTWSCCLVLSLLLGDKVLVIWGICLNFCNNHLMITAMYFLIRYKLLCEFHKTYFNHHVGCVPFPAVWENHVYLPLMI